MGLIIAGRGTAAYADESGRYALNVRHTVTSGDQRHYVWQLWANGNLLDAGGGLKGPNATPVEMLGGLVTFLAADGERFYSALRGQEDNGGWNTTEDVARWAYGVVDELWTATAEIGARVRK
jgi:hypothetical protein